MDRRTFLCLTAATTAAATGCRSHNYAHILKGDDIDLVGSHQAGAAVWNPLVDESVAKLMGRCVPGVQAIQPAGPEEIPPGVMMPASHQLPLVGTRPATVCFVGIENKSSEEIGDFKDQLYERIDSQVSGHDSFQLVSRRMVEAALRETRLRPDSLFLPTNRDVFAGTLGRQGSPIDFLMHATITSGTTERNKSTQRDYLLSLEITNIHTGEYFKESATIRKGYHGSRGGKWWQYGVFQQGDG
ncbi:penicillin-binding protein activator LpoB [Rosistilla oblonga]|uniref:penicillin-binding protein activator LpoB n=1 Tax=Rosistilla oblonga TaxID=2527990 RepID=UPI003A97C976